MIRIVAADYSNYRRRNGLRDLKLLYCLTQFKTFLINWYFLLKHGSKRNVKWIYQEGLSIFLGLRYLPCFNRKSDFLGFEQGGLVSRQFQLLHLIFTSLQQLSNAKNIHNKFDRKIKRREQLEMESSWDVRNFIFES